MGLICFFHSLDPFVFCSANKLPIEMAAASCETEEKWCEVGQILMECANDADRFVRRGEFVSKQGQTSRPNQFTQRSISPSSS